jgi:uncharacterized membrane protein YcgQ (UPF0703/DUF1980 family)
MLRKTLTLLLTASLLLSAACSKTGTNTLLSQASSAEAATASANSSDTQSQNAGDGTQPGTDTESSDTAPSSPFRLPQGSGTDGIDIDLTTLSANMVYAQVYDMVCYPDNYIGKTVKMEGQFAFYHDEEKDRYYFACIIADALACCQQGLEFEPEDKNITIDDFPESGKIISVTGTFNTYKEGDKTYCVIQNAKFN